MDATENTRRELVAQVNENAGEREPLQGKHGQVWDTRELQQDFEVIGFAAPFIVVRRKADGAVGSLMFQHRPRYYFGFVEEAKR